MRNVKAAGGEQPTEISLRAAVEGLRFVFSADMIRATMLLDFFATFFSSATALLPIFAQDILHVGARGYGWLYAAPSVGALVASGGMVRLIDRIDRRGRVLLWAVAAYGAATIVFGVSRSFWLTFACLALTGAADTVSMVLRNIIRQLTTPGPAARPHDQRQHDLLHGRAAVGRTRSRPRGQLVRGAVFGGQRWPRLPRGHRSRCGRHARAPTLSAGVMASVSVRKLPRAVIAVQFTLTEAFEWRKQHTRSCTARGCLVRWGRHSPGVIYQGLIFVSGQGATNPATGRLAGLDVESQTEQALLNIRNILEAAGSRLDCVLRCGVFLVDMRDFQAMNAVYERVLGAHRPARTTVGVAGLPAQGLRVEIDAVAYVAEK